MLKHSDEMTTTIEVSDISNCLEELKEGLLNSKVKTYKKMCWTAFSNGDNGATFFFIDEAWPPKEPIDYYKSFIRHRFKSRA